MMSSHPEPEKGQDDYEPSHSSNLSEIPKPEEKVTLPESSEPLDEAAGQYYRGKRLAIVVVSLMLSTFLVSLDNVSEYLRNPLPQCVLTLLDGRQSLPLRFPESQMSFTVSTTCHGTAQHIS